MTDEKDRVDELKKNAFGSIPTYNVPASSSPVTRPIPDIPFRYVEGVMPIAHVS